MKKVEFMKIGLAQIDCVVGDLESNCARFSGYASRAKAEGCDVVIFPEMSDTGYVPSAIRQCAQSWSGPAFAAARSAAAENAISLICGISEREEGTIFNTVAFLDAAGELRGKYRKTHLFSAPPVREDDIFAAGSELPVVVPGGLKWGLSICYDLRFPELYRALTLEGAQALLNCSAWPASRAAHWDCLTRARAIENQAFFVGVGRVGIDGGLKMNGHSRVVTPRGEILCEGDGESEELLVAELDLALMDEFRNEIPALSSRRVDLYG